MQNTTAYPSHPIRNIVKGTAARAKLAVGVQALVKAVSVTLGPKGRNVVIEKNYGSPLVTKDGVSVAEEVDLSDPFEQMGAQLVKGAAKKTSDSAGDGTTTSTVIAGFLYEEGLKLVEAGTPPVAMKRGMDKAVEYLSEALIQMSFPVRTQDQIRQVGTISANGDAKVGTILAEAIEKVGRDGVIQIREGQGTDLQLEIVEGMQWDRGPIVTEFLIKDGVEISLDDVTVFVSDISFDNPRLLLSLLGELAEEGKPVLFVCPDFTPQATGALWANMQKGSLISLPVRAPGFGDRQTQYLQDIATLTGATFITKEAGWKFEDVKREHLGFAKKVVSTRTDTTITGGGGGHDKLMERVAQIRAQIRNSTSEFDKEKLQERLSKLLGGVCTLLVGAHTEVEMKELKARIEDALHATRSSVDEGVVPGGGTALLRAGDFVKSLTEPVEGSPFPEGVDERRGWDLVLKATEAPFRAILKNAGYRSSLLIEKVLDSGVQFGVDATTGEIVDMMERGIIDPTRVVREALINANSVVSTMLTTECLVRKPDSSQGNPGEISFGLPSLRVGLCDPPSNAPSKIRRSSLGQVSHNESSWPRLFFGQQF